MSEDLDYDLLFPGQFIKAGEFNGRDVTLTIARIELMMLPQDKGGEKTRGVIYFQNAKKGLVLNRTNGECMKAMWGRNVAEWSGKRVTLYPTMVKFGREDVLAVRVKGSPDLTEPLQVEVKLPKKKPALVTMLPTGKKPKPAPEPVTTSGADEGDEPNI